MNPAVLSLLSLALNFVLGGGLLAVWLKYRVQVRDEDRADFGSIIAAMKSQRDDERERLKEQGEKIERLEAEINGLRLARDLDPFPSWVVDLQGCYRYVNRAFEESFLEPKKQTYRDVIGRSRKDVWPESFCATLLTLDTAARKRPDGTARATAQIDVPSLGLCEVMVHKFPIRFKGAIVAFAGFITVMEPIGQKIGA